MKKELGILWFRQDLRLHDNEALENVMTITKTFLPVYIFDPRLLNGELPGGIPRFYRTRILFLLESIRDLRQNLRNAGSDLIVRTGEPEQILYDLSEEYQVDGVFCNRERMPHGTKVQDALEERLWSISREMYYSRGKMLFHTSDLPFPVIHTPDQYSTFLKETENFISVRHSMTSHINSIQFPEVDLDPGLIPELSDFGFTEPYNNPDFRGGETIGILQLERSMKKLIYREEGHLHISPWLSHGNISPKHIYHKIDEATQIDESIRRKIKRGLILRDYYRLMGKKNPRSLFDKGGFRHEPDHTGEWDLGIFKDWLTGNTGHDFVDACMKRLMATGYLDHKERKVVAHFLIDELNVHWLLGAGYFESVLLDYDPCSNYGNWQRVAGLSLDLKGRYMVNFDLIGDQMDPDRSFRQKWLDYVVAKETLRCFGD